MLERIEARFFQVGWLLPLLLPITELGGRALFNSIWGIYFLWGLLAVARSRVSTDRIALLLFAAMLVGYMLGVPAAADQGVAIHAWLKFALHSLVFYFTLVALERDADAVSRLLSGLGVAALAYLALIYLLLPFLMGSPEFEATVQLKEDSLPFLVPFGLLWLERLGARRWRIAAALGLLALALAYIVLSQGRAALAGLLAALIVYAFVVLRWRLMKVAAGAIVLLAITVVASSDYFFRTAVAPDQALPEVAADADWVGLADRFSSFRTELWRNALQHPPENVWIGVGVGNIGIQDAVMTIESGFKLGHLHNFLLDAWYETGFIGLAGLVAFLGYCGMRGVQTVRRGGVARPQAGVLLASMIAILTSGLLSFSYTSKQFSVYLLVLCAALVYLARKRSAKPSVS